MPSEYAATLTSALITQSIPVQAHHISATCGDSASAYLSHQTLQQGTAEMLQISRTETHKAGIQLGLCVNTAAAAPQGVTMLERAHHLSIYAAGIVARAIVPTRGKYATAVALYGETREVNIYGATFILTETHN